MIDAMNFGAFKVGYGNQQPRESAAFALDIRPGYPLRDRISGVEAICNIPGDRWGVVKGVLTKIPAYKAAVVDDGLRVCPAFTQQFGCTENFADPLWLKNGFAAPAVEGQLNGCNISTFQETFTTGVRQITQVIKNIPADNSVLVLLWVVKSGRNKCRAGIKAKNGSVYGATFDLTSNEVTNISTNIIAFIYDHPTDQSFKVIGISRNASTGASVPTGYLYQADGVSYAGDGVSKLYVTQPRFFAIGVAAVPFIPPYTPNNTSGAISVASEAATATMGIIFDFDNVKLTRLNNILRGTHGHLEIIVKSNTESVWLANNTAYNILSINNTSASVLYVHKDLGGIMSFRMTDGTNIASVTQSLTLGAVYNISLDWGSHTTGQKMRITVNGVPSSLADFSGPLGLEHLLFGVGNTIDLCNISKFEAYDRPIW